MKKNFYSKLKKLLIVFLAVLTITTSVNVVHAEDIDTTDISIDENVYYNNETDIGEYVDMDSGNNDEMIVYDSYPETSDLTNQNTQLMTTNLQANKQENVAEEDGNFYASATKLKDAATKIEETNLRQIKINYDTFTLLKNPGEMEIGGITAGGRFNFNCDDASDPTNKEGTYIPARVGDEFVISYPDSMTIDGKKITLNVSVKYVEDIDWDSVNPGITPEGTAYVGKAKNKIRIQNRGGKYLITYKFFDEDGKPYKFTGVIGVSDPDMADILWDNTNRGLYYIDGHPDNYQAFENVSSDEWFSNWATVDSTGLHFRILPRIDVWDGARSTVSFRGHSIYIELNNESTFQIKNESMHWDSHDTLFTPYLYYSLSNKEVKETKTVQRTIHYWIDKVNGTKAFDDKLQKVTFTRTNIVDANNNVITHGTWTPTSSSFDAVNNPNKSGYYVSSVAVGGKSQSDLTKVTASNNITASSGNIEADVIYKSYHKITTKIDRGTITKEITNIKDGETKTVEWKPADGYYVSKVTIDGKAQSNLKDNGDSYEFKNITKDHDVVVNTLPYYQIETDVVNGTIDKKITNIKKGENKTIKYSPNEGYLLSTITIDDVLQDISKIANETAFNNIGKNHKIKVVYEKQEAPTKSVLDNEGNDINGLTVDKGTHLNYEITVKNPTGVNLEYTITDRVPENTIFISADNDGINNNGVVTWKIQVPANSSKTVKMVVEANVKATQQINKATSETKDPTGKIIILDTNEVTTDTPDEPIKMVKDDVGNDINKKMQVVGNTLVYEISFKNPSNKTKNFTITDKLPEDVEFVLADNDGKYEEGIVTWNLALEAKQEKSVSFTVLIKEGAQGKTLKNKATVKVDGSSQDTNEVENPVLEEPSKEVLNEKGEDINGLNVSNEYKLIYRLSAHNSAKEEKSFVFMDVIPEDTELVKIDNDGVLNEKTNTISWEKTLQPDETLTVSYTVKTIKFGTYIPNEASLFVDGIERKTNLVENHVPSKPVKTVRDEDGKDASQQWLIAQDNRELTYGIYFENPSNHEVEVTITDTLDKAWTFVEASDEATYDEATKTITWKINLPAKGNYEVTAKVTPIATMAECRMDNEANVKMDEFDHKTNMVTNFLKDDPATIDLEGVKKWEDNNNEYGLRPESIVIELFANGELFKTQKVTGESNEWKYSFERLPKYSHGTEVVYTIGEQKVKGYVSSVDGLNITNKLTGTLENPIKYVKDERGNDINGKDVKVGDILTYQIEINNTLDTDIDVIVTDALPAGLKFVSADYSGQLINNEVKWEASIKAKQKLILTFKVEVLKSDEKIFKNTAQFKLKDSDKTFTTNTVQNPKVETEEKSDTPTPQPQNPKNQTKVVNTGAR